jgi:hypothetical protein
VVGWTWWALAAFLVGVNLPTYYIQHGARLTYLGAVGGVLVWTFTLESLRTLPRHGRRIWLGALGVILVTGGLFVHGRLSAFADIAGPLAVIEESLSGQPPDEGILLVNLPAWTSPWRNLYATGAEYVTLMGRHLFAEELIEENLRTHRPVLAVGAPELRTEPGYHYDYHDQAGLDVIPADWTAAGSHVFITHYAPEGVQTQYTGRLLPQSKAPANQPLATFGPYRLLAASATRCGDTVTVMLDWQPTETLSNTLPVSLEMLGTNGAMVAESDAPPIGLEANRLAVPAGWILTDRRELAVESTSPNEILVRILDPASSKHLQPLGADAHPLPGNAWRQPITDCPSKP